MAEVYDVTALSLIMMRGAGTGPAGKMLGVTFLDRTGRR